MAIRSQTVTQIHWLVLNGPISVNGRPISSYNKTNKPDLETASIQARVFTWGNESQGLATTKSPPHLSHFLKCFWGHCLFIHSVTALQDRFMPSLPHALFTDCSIAGRKAGGIARRYLACRLGERRNGQTAADRGHAAGGDLRTCVLRYECEPKHWWAPGRFLSQQPVDGTAGRRAFVSGGSPQHPAATGGTHTTDQ